MSIRGAMGICKNSKAPHVEIEGCMDWELLAPAAKEDGIPEEPSEGHKQFLEKFNHHMDRVEEHLRVTSLREPTCHICRETRDRCTDNEYCPGAGLWPKLKPVASLQEPEGRNIHGELLPEGYRFTQGDEARLDSQDFYTHKDQGSIPPVDITEADRFMAWRWYGQFFSPMREELLKSMAWRISRERQMLKSVSPAYGVRKELIAAIVEAIVALRTSYNVQDFPADGDTSQDHAANKLEAELRKLRSQESKEDVPGDEIDALVAEVCPPALVVSDTAVRQLRPLLEELLRLRRQETPQEAWKRGFKEGYRYMALVPMEATEEEIPPYVAPPLPYQEEKETGR